jgi:hypothetical protein
MELMFFLLYSFFLEVAGLFFAFDALEVLDHYVAESLVLKQHLMFQKLVSLNTAGGVSVELDKQLFELLIQNLLPNYIFELD